MSAPSPADQLALDALVSAYALAVDALDEAALLDCFEPGAELDFGGGAWRGREQLRGIVAAVADAERRFHQLGTRLFEAGADGAEATGVVYCTALAVRRDDDGRPRLQRFAVRYDDVYARGADSRFRIRRRALTTLWSE